MATTPTNPNQNLALSAGLIILIVFAAIYFFLVPQLTTKRTSLEAAKAQLAGAQADLATLQKAKAELDSARSSLQSKGVDFTKIENSVFPATEDVPGLYVQLDNLMGQAAAIGVTGTYQVSNPVVDTNKNASVPVSFNVTGSFPNLEKFITLAENNSRPLLLSNISFDQATGTAGSPAAPGSLTLTASANTKVGSISSAYSSSSSN